MRIPADDDAPQVFEKAFEEFRDAIFRHCYFHLFHRERALELMQETFLKTWEYLAQGKDIENVRPFLYRVATNLIYNESRRKPTVSLETLQEAGFDPGSEDERLSRDVLQEERVLRLLHALEEPYRRVVLLRFVEGLQPAEIAEITGESANAISVRLHRALKQLRSHLGHG